MCVLPMVSSLVAQVLMGLVAMIPAMVIAIGEAAAQGITDPTEQYNYAMAGMMDAAPAGVLLYHIVSIPLFGIWLYFGFGRKKPQKPNRVFSVKSIVTVVLLSFGLCFFANAFVMFASYVAPKAMEQYMALVETAGLGTDVLTIIASVLLAPIGEEILCRGIILNYAKKVTNGMRSTTAAFWIANAIQALMFGIMHANWIQGGYAFFLGLGLGWLCEKYKSLYPAMLGHCIINAASTFLMSYLLAPVPDSVLGCSIVAVISIVLVALGALADRDKKIAA